MDVGCYNRTIKKQRDDQMLNQLILIAGTPETKQTLHHQLQEILGEFIEIKSYAVDEYLPAYINNELVVFSSGITEKEAGDCVDPQIKTLTAHRTMNYQHIERLFELPHGTQVLCVNDTKEMAIHTIDKLKTIGMKQFEYEPYYPGGPPPLPSIKTAITPGEVGLVPDHIGNVVNIGVRLIDITTLFDILDHFQLKDKLGGIISSRYTQKIIELSKKVSEMYQTTQKLNHHLQQVVDGINDGIMACDKHGKVTVFNPFMEKYTGLTASYALDKSLPQLFRSGELLMFLQSPQEEGKYFSINHFNVMVYRVQWQESGDVIIIFKNTEETILMEKAARKKLRETGYIAKYFFEDIIGKSSSIAETRNIAAKLGRTNLPVLIQGESGTGKELFASAIHNHSDERYKPFLAVNCSALPDDLLESELFGYEEGAFTGAKKGGKQGLFEQADGGTIFLDEIGDISLKLQARLLRVLQEMEVRKIGGSKNIPIIVRVIAATNKDLNIKVAKGEFREDLFYRLKVLFLQIPSLRQRKQDIPLLVEKFLVENKNAHRELSSSLMTSLQNYTWPGNIRELKNIVAYLITVGEGNMLTRKDLIGHPFFQQADPVTASSMEDEKYIAVLRLISDIQNKEGGASRKRISEQSTYTKVVLTEQQVRRIVKELEEIGYVRIKRGRTGTQLTQDGEEYLKRGFLN